MHIFKLPSKTLSDFTLPLAMCTSQFHSAHPDAGLVIPHPSWPPSSLLEHSLSRAVFFFLLLLLFCLCLLTGFFGFVRFPWCRMYIGFSVVVFMLENNSSSNSTLPLTEFLLTYWANLYPARKCRLWAGWDFLIISILSPVPTPGRSSSGMRVWLKVMLKIIWQEIYLNGVFVLGS